MFDVLAHICTRWNIVTMTFATQRLSPLQPCAKKMHRRQLAKYISIQTQRSEPVALWMGWAKHTESIVEARPMSFTFHGNSTNVSGENNITSIAIHFVIGRCSMNIHKRRMQSWKSFGPMRGTQSWQWHINRVVAIDIWIVHDLIITARGGSKAGNALGIKSRVIGSSKSFNRALQSLPLKLSGISFPERINNA
jgi:hypothetical protein